MTFEYDKYSDMLLVSISEPSSPCVYVESQTPGVILRVEETTGIVRSFEVLLWSRRVSSCQLLVPEVSDTDFQNQWISNLRLLESQQLLGERAQ